MSFIENLSVRNNFPFFHTYNVLFFTHSEILDILLKVMETAVRETKGKVIHLYELHRLIKLTQVLVNIFFKMLLL